MRERDKAILRDLTRFRCLTRDHIAAIHFVGLKRSITQANMVLKRLRRDGHIAVSTDRRKYVYFPVPATVKKDSAKMPHFLAIADFYVNICTYEMPSVFDVEPKVGEKGSFPEPDVFMIWRGHPYYVEVQRSYWTEKEFRERMERYNRFVLSEVWKDFSWQPANPRFPRVWILSEVQYTPVDLAFKMMQTRTVDELFQPVKVK